MKKLISVIAYVLYCYIEKNIQIHHLVSISAKSVFADGVQVNSVIESVKA